MEVVRKATQLIHGTRIPPMATDLIHGTRIPPMATDPIHGTPIPRITTDLVLYAAIPQIEADWDTNLERDVIARLVREHARAVASGRPRGVHVRERAYSEI